VTDWFCRTLELFCDGHHDAITRAAPEISAGPVAVLVVLGVFGLLVGQRRWK
jgi:hypothetical protein